MKKLLSLLTSMVLVSSSASSLISCSSITSSNTKEANIKPGVPVIKDMASKIAAINGSSFIFDSSEIKDVYSWVMSKTIKVENKTNEYTYKSTILKNYIKNKIFKKAGIQSNATNLGLVSIVTASSGENPAIVLNKQQNFNLLLFDSKDQKTFSFNFSFQMNRSTKKESFADLKTRLKNKIYDLNNFQFTNKKSDFNFYDKSGFKSLTKNIISEVSNSVAYSSINNNHITFNQFNDVDNLIEEGLKTHFWHVGYNTITVNSSDKKQNFTFSIYAHWSQNAYNAYLDNSNILGWFWSQSDLLLPNTDLNKKLNSADVLKDTKNALLTQKFNIFGKSTSLMDETDVNRIIANNTVLADNTFTLNNKAASLTTQNIKVQSYFETNAKTYDINVNFVNHVILTVQNIANAIKDKAFFLDSSFNGKTPEQALVVIKKELIANGILTKLETQYLSASNSATQSLKSNHDNERKITIKNPITGKTAEANVVMVLHLAASDFAKEMGNAGVINIDVAGLNTVDASSDYKPGDNPAFKYINLIKESLVKYANNIDIPGQVTSTIKLDSKFTTNLYNGDNKVPMQLTYKRQTAVFYANVEFRNGIANHSGFHGRHSGNYNYLDIDISHYACLKMMNSINNTFYNYLFYKSADWRFPHQYDTNKWLVNTNGSLDSDIHDWFQNDLDSDNQYRKGIWNLNPSASLNAYAKTAYEAYNGTGSLRLVILGIWSSSHNKVGVGYRIVKPTDPLLDNRTV